MTCESRFPELGTLELGEWYPEGEAALLDSLDFLDFVDGQEEQERLQAGRGAFTQQNASFGECCEDRDAVVGESSPGRRPDRALYPVSPQATREPGARALAGGTHQGGLMPPHGPGEEELAPGCWSSPSTCSARVPSKPRSARGAHRDKGNWALDASGQDSPRSAQQPEDDLSEVLSVVRALYGSGAYAQAPCSPTNTLDTSSPTARTFQDPRSPRMKDMHSWSYRNHMPDSVNSLFSAERYPSIESSMTMFNLQTGTPTPHCDGADSKAWGMARRDSLSFLDHGIGPAAAAAVISRRPMIPELQTAPSWGSLANQTLAMYPEEAETLQCLPPICEKELPPSELAVHTCVTTPFSAWHKDNCQSDSDREADISWPRLHPGHGGHSPNTLARMQQAFHSEYASRQVGQLGQPAGAGSPGASSSGTQQNLTSIPEGGPLQDADADPAAFLIKGLQTEAGQHDIADSPCAAPVPCSEQQQQGLASLPPGAVAAGPGPPQASPCKPGAATSPPVSPRGSAALPSNMAVSHGSSTSQLPATHICSTQDEASEELRCLSSLGHEELTDSELALQPASILAPSHVRDMDICSAAPQRRDSVPSRHSSASMQSPGSAASAQLQQAFPAQPSQLVGQPGLSLVKTESGTENQVPLAAPAASRPCLARDTGPVKAGPVPAVHSLAPEHLPMLPASHPQVKQEAAAAAAGPEATLEDPDGKGIKRNRTHQKDYTQRKRSKVAAVHACVPELKRRRAELEAELAITIARHQVLTDELPWEKQLEEVQFMASLGKFRLGTLQSMDSVNAVHKFMSDPLDSCEAIVGAAQPRRAARLQVNNLEASYAGMSPVARRVLFGPSGEEAMPGERAHTMAMSELVTKLRLSKAQKNSLASEARRTVTALEMMQDDSDAAAASLQGSLAMSLGSSHNMWRGMLITHTVLGQLQGIPKVAAEFSQHLIKTCTEVLKPVQAKKLPYAPHRSLGMCLFLCEEVESIRQRQGAVCKATVVTQLSKTLMGQ